MKFPSPIAAVVGLVLSPLATGMDCPSKDNSIIAHTGTSVGKIETHGGGECGALDVTCQCVTNLWALAVSMYITGDPKSTSAVLYLTDVFGIQLAENRLLADSFGRAGFLVVAPDLFNATPAPADLTSPGFDTGAFLAKHGPDATDPLIAAGIRYLRGEAGVKTIGVTGYCFGGRYSFRAASKKGLGADGVRADVAFAAHPSLLEDAEITGVGGPASVAAAGE